MVIDWKHLLAVFHLLLLVVATTGIDGGGHMTYQNNISGIYGPIVLSAEDGGTHGISVQQQLQMGNMGYC